jgi:DNA-binding transcriptional MerR regulator
LLLSVLLATDYCLLATLKILLDPGTNSGVYNDWVAAEMTKKARIRSGELARLAGVSTDTLRHYERKGALAAPRRSVNGYREYETEALARVLLVRRALGVGFTLDELARIFRDRARGGVPCREVREMASAKLALIETRLSELEAVREDLQATIKGWDSRLARTPRGERAGLLEALAAVPSTNDKRVSPVNSDWSRRKRSKEKKP